MMPLKRCYNGCDAPPHPPSLVLCAPCFAVLDANMRAFFGMGRAPDPDEGADARDELKERLPMPTPRRSVEAPDPDEGADARDELKERR